MFGTNDRAREEDIVLGLALSVELDQHPQLARESLEKLIGPPTIVVRSGGTWTDPATGEACDNSWFAIEIEPPLSLDSQRELTVLIEAPSAPASEGLAFWYEPSPSGKGRAGTKDGLDLAFRTWLRPPGWSPPAPMEDEVAPNGLADGELVVRLAVALREEREARRQLERRLSRVEVRAAAAQFNAGQRDTALRGLRKLRGTLPYKAARRLYRMLKP